jgi:hypothetical protein
MYLDDLAATIRGYIPEDRIPAGDAEELLRWYAVMARAKGTAVTQSDVHDVWSAWIARRDPDHESLVEYANLPESVRQQDAVFASAVRAAAENLGLHGPSRALFTEVLFPSGPPTGGAETKQALELYKIMVQSSEGLVGRRQAVNTFFITMNGALLTGFGIIIQSSSGNQIAAPAVAILAIAGSILCLAWRSLIVSFGQLNRGKFEVINTIERYFKAAIYAAEWEALERGENPKVYRSFTSREIWVPNALLVVHAVVAAAALAIYFRWLSL